MTYVKPISEYLYHDRVPQDYVVFHPSTIASSMGIVFLFAFCLRGSTEAHHDVTSGLMSKIIQSRHSARTSHSNQC